MTSALSIRGAERLIVVVGPSGAGKDAVLSAWLEGLPVTTWVHLARRSITRAAHAGSEDHEPLGDAAFADALASGAFALHWSAHGLSYGVRWAELAPLPQGGWVVMNGSREHLPALRAVAPAVRVVAIDAPADLRRGRLGRRGREAETSIAARLQRESAPIAADLMIVNDGSLAEAVARLGGWWQRLSQSLPADAAQASG